MSHKTLKALIDLYYNYLKKAKEPDKEAYSWSNTQDQIILQWAGGDSATMHVLVVHAMIILLTYGAPNRESHYEELLKTWFPETGSPPSAFLLDTSEEALLLPDWLKLRMIRSHVKRLVNVALQDTEPGQLLLFVQSFGIPVASMSQLLCCLDQAVDNDPVILEEGIEDKMYMSQLIEIQHMRGAKGGDKLYKLLTKNIPPEVKGMEDAEMMDESGSLDRKWKFDIKTESHEPETYQQMTDVLRKMFTHDQQKDSNIEKEYQKLLMGVASNNHIIINNLSRVLLELLAGPEGTVFAKGLCLSVKACPLIKQLICKKDLIGEPFNRLMEILSGIAKIVKNQKSPLASIINQYFTGIARKKNVEQSSRRFIERSMAKDKEFRSLCVKDVLDEVGEDSDMLERIVRDCMTVCMSSNRKQSTNYIMSDVLQMHSQSQRCKMSESMAVLLVDWLEILQPEIVNFTQEVDQLLLFAKDLLHDTNVQMESDSRPYLLALLTHQSSWKTLNSCVNCLLKREVLTSYNPSLVLDFLWACTHIPKIWQGREKTVPKVSQKYFRKI
ncbi:hypothetical protein KUTeg_003258 [Tegillarca granosa]|uniref:Integrator complex subunit 1 INTS2-binding domain-containing protein n=1 Tax=Tegillarca granosa TaxID=220873 RepID=A0ABQ9FNF4_TEGGR|nr:hypothetical protein KUTeg_003258 [Tegillarca granosa]